MDLGMVGTIRRTLRPIYSGLKHIFVKPYTVKWPYERVPNVPRENYRYDPKAGIAYPGYKGRHILYMEMCTGCSSCDLACQNIAEAITMTCAFDVYISMDEKSYAALESSDKEISYALNCLIGSFSSVSRDVKYNSLSSFYRIPADFRRVETSDGLYRFKLNPQPIFDSRSFEVFSEKLHPGIGMVAQMGWGYEVKTATAESTVVKASKDGLSIELSVQKLDMGYKQNKRSLFPSVDYGRCVFCGFCVDACPFNSLEMTDEFELSGMTKGELLYTPPMLSRKPEEFILTGTPPELDVLERTRIVFRRLTW